MALGARIIDGTLQLLESLLHTRQQFPAFGRHMHFASIATEQGPCQILLQGTDLDAHGAGRDAQCIGGPREAQVLRDRDKDAQASQRQPAHAWRRRLTGAGALALRRHALVRGDVPDLLTV
jgi:hypothetical protein